MPLYFVEQEREDALQREKDAIAKANERWKEQQTRANEAQEAEVMNSLREVEKARYSHSARTSGGCSCSCGIVLCRRVVQYWQTVCVLSCCAICYSPDVAVTRQRCGLRRYCAILHRRRCTAFYTRSPSFFENNMLPSRELSLIDRCRRDIPVERPRKVPKNL